MKMVESNVVKLRQEHWKSLTFYFSKSWTGKGYLERRTKKNSVNKNIFNLIGSILLFIMLGRKVWQIFLNYFPPYLSVSFSSKTFRILKPQIGSFLYLLKKKNLDCDKFSIISHEKGKKQSQKWEWIPVSGSLGLQFCLLSSLSNCFYN